MDLDTRAAALAEARRGYRPLSSIAESGATAPKVDPRQNSFLLDESESETAAQPSEVPKKRQRMTYSCEDCGTSYTEKRTLARHRHTDQHRHRVGLPPIRKYPCTFCGKLFGRDHDRHRHENEKHKNEGKAAAQEWPKQKQPAPGWPNQEQTAQVWPKQEDSPRGWPLPEPTPTASNAAAAMTAATSAQYVMMPQPTMPSMTPSNLSPASMVMTDSVSTASISPAAGVEAFLEADPIIPAASSSSHHRQLSDGNVAYAHDPRSASLMEEIEYSKPPAQPPLGNRDPQLSRVAQLLDDANGKSRNDSAVNIHFRKSISPPYGGSSSDITLEEETPRATPASAPTPTPMQNFTRPRVSVIQRQGKTNIVGAPRPRICIMCDAPFEHDMDGLIPHLRQHMETFRGEHRCDECQIVFVHGQDLERHRKSAEKGHCGFSFNHDTPCTGHHPPDEFFQGNLSDRDRFQLCNQLRHWEQSQLRTYITDINNLVSSRTEKDVDSYSIEALIRHSRNSFASFAVSVNTHATAPCDQTPEGQWDIGGLQRRLKLMSIKDASEPVQQIVSREVSTMGGKGLLNKDMYKAIHRGDLARVEKDISMGADAQMLRVQEPLLTAAALWDRTQLWAQLSAHGAANDGMAGDDAYCDCALANPDAAGDADLVRALLQHGLDPLRDGGLCGYPLSTAAYMGKPALVQILLDAGANVNHKGGKYAVPLCFAAAGAAYPGNREVARILIERGADVYAASPEGSALQLARKQRDLWSLRGMEMDRAQNEVRERVTCCEKMIKYLQSVGGKTSKGKWLKW